jgi:hypothetical protein
MITYRGEEGGKGKSRKTTCVFTNLGGDPVHDVPDEHEPLLPPKLNRRAILLLPPARGQSGPCNARWGSTIDTSTSTGTSTGKRPSASANTAKAACHPWIVCGRRRNDNSSRILQSCRAATTTDDDDTVAATATTTIIATATIRGGRRRRIIAEQADIERGLWECVLLRERCDLFHASILRSTFIVIVIVIVIKSLVDGVGLVNTFGS